MRKIKNYILFILKTIFLFILSTQNITLFAQEITSAGYLQKTDLDVGLRSDPEFADIDNDGDLDFYIGRSIGRVLVFLNDGNNNFTSAGYLQADGSDIITGSDSSPEFADLDNDGDLDLYISEYLHGYIKVYRNDGSGNFTSIGNLQADGVDINLGVNHRLVPEFADIDGDSDLDLYIGHYYGTIRFYRNDGGDFTSAGYLQADGSDIDIGSYATPAFADIDGDSDLDLYVGEGDGTINIFTNDGSGVFTSIGKLQADGSNIDVGDNAIPLFADLDGDSDLDLYVGEYEGVVNIFLNDGNGNYTSNGYVQADGSIIDVGDNAAPVFADIYSDSIPLLFIGEKGGTIQAFSNDGNNNFSFAGKLQADSIIIDVGSYATPTFADVDGDSDLDLYVGDYDGFINVFTNDSGNFASADSLQADNININVGSYSKPTFADIDGDGDLDLYVGEGDGTINIFTNNGNGSFSSTGKLQADGSDIDVGSESSPTFTDIDCDNDLDLFIGEKDRYIHAYINDGGGNFSSVGLLQEDGSDIDTYKGVLFFAKFPEDCFQSLYVGRSHGVISVFNVKDSLYPVITSTHNDTIVSDEGNCVATLSDYTSNVTVTDNCDANIDITQNPRADTTFSGSIQVTLTATDDCGNYSEVSFNVTIADTTNPVITCPGNQEVYADYTHTYTVNGSEFDPVDTTDNCGIASIINNFNDATTLSGAELSEGTTSIVWTVTDNNGNEGTCSFDIFVNFPVGIESLHDKGISIYPNPSSEKVNIDFAENNIKNLEIINVNGRKVFEKSIIKTHEEIILSNFNPGVYIIKIETDKEILTAKIIKK